MDYFQYKNGALHCEGVNVADIAAAAGTPVYIYSAATLTQHYDAMAKAFAELRPTICFSIKSLANIHLLRLLAQRGCGFDVVSGGELHRARLAGGDMSKVAFAGVGKSDSELIQAINAGIGLFNIESEAEFENLSRLAGLAGRKVRAALRVNPDVYDPKTHTYTATGKKESKFGVDIDRAAAFFASAARNVDVTLDGVHLHLGSPIYSARPYVEAIIKTLGLIDELGRRGTPVRLLDIGGGFAADYGAEDAPTAAQYAADIVPLLRGRDLEFVIEPGRQIACNSAILLSRVLYTKTGGEKSFIIADASMTDLIRPALYDARHFVWPARLDGGAEPPRDLNYAAPDGMRADVVGGVCESSDFLAKDRVLPPMHRGDLLAVFSAGAYSFVMSSQYNSRPRAAEVLVEGDKWRVIRRRETYDDLVAAELDCS